MTQAFSGQIDGLDINTAQSAQRVIAAAVVGGTTSVISGGKFGNGAVTGAFSRALNDELHEKAEAQKEKSLEQKISDDPSTIEEKFDQVVNKLTEKGLRKLGSGAVK